MTTNERMRELLPCPFCGGNQICVNVGICIGKVHESVTIKCDDCGASIWGVTEEKAITAWNRRVSMISSLIDELNKSADEWNSSNMFELARMCREAADTILELRDDLQRANDAVRDAEHDESRVWDRVRKAEAESARLRSELESVGTAAYMYGRSDLKAENARLCKLVQRMWPAFIGEKRATFADRLHVRAEVDELGVEVS